MNTFLLTELARGHTVLTANERLTRLLKRAYYHQYPQRECQTPPRVLPLTAWLQAQWEQCLLQDEHCPQHWLTPAQSEAWWWQLMTTTPHSPLFLDAWQTVTHVAEAWERVQLWQLPLSQLMEQGGEDSHWFVALAQRYQQQLTQARACDSVSIYAYLTTAHREHHWCLQTPTYLYGGDPFTPRQQAFFKQVGIEQATMDPRQDPPQIHRHEFFDANTEWHAMAQWLKAQPDSKVSACVIPELQTHRDAIERIFQQVFDAEPISAAFTCASAQPLAQVPVIHIALRLLQYDGHSWPLLQWQSVLTNPYLIADEADGLQRQRSFALLLAATPRSHYTLSELHDSLVDASDPLKTQLKAWIDHQRSRPPQASIMDWAANFQQVLTIVGWPGRWATTPEIEAVHADWERVTLQWLRLHSLGSLSANQAWEHLQRICFQHRFQPPQHFSHKGLLGLYEALDQPFDGVWIGGLTAQSFPERVHPNPFIPQSLQRRHHLPKCSQAQALNFAQHLLDRLAQQTPVLIFSHPTHRGEIPQAPSPLIHAHPLQPFIGDAQWHDAEAKNAGAAREAYSDHQAPAVASTETLRGGSQILQRQAQCAFQAFAKIRLQAEQPELEPETGITPQQRGTLIHACLEHVWQELKSQQRLLELDDSERTARLEHHIHRVLTQRQRHFPALAVPLYFTTEAACLRQILQHWLRVESARPPFTVIDIEKTLVVPFGAHRLTIKMDRLDQDDAGRWFLIDYKTGLSQVKAWLDEPLTAPQLPFYSEQLTYPIHGLLFAALHPQQMSYLGLTWGDCGIPGATIVDSAAAWQTHREQWRQQLTQLTSDFLSGIAKAQPQTPQTCVYCDLPGLCRVAQLNSAESEA